MYSLGYLLVRDELHRMSEAEPDSVEALSSTTVLYRSEIFDEGIRYLTKAYDAGVVEAAYQLGRVYELGPQYDYKLALQPYIWAAERGHDKAAYCAANILYMYGDGLSRSKLTGEAILYQRRAFDLYKQAAEGGILDAMNSLG
jgi:TPR repeat protein